MPGDVFVALGANDDGIGTEGYVLEIGVGVTIRAKTPAGVFYGSRSLLQMLIAGQSSLLPFGPARDYPQYAERGFMLDISSHDPRLQGAMFDFGVTLRVKMRSIECWRQCRP